jgi:hypothetical protein
MINNSLKLIFAIPALFLLCAPIFKFPYGYYVLLRILISITAIFIIYYSYKTVKGINETIVLFFLILILFNPIIPIHLPRFTWMIIDFIVIGIYGYTYFKFSKYKTSNIN